eukprot:scaffold4410_cov44-Attheya_sp.AAC.4
MTVITRATPAGPCPVAAVPVTQQPTTTVPASPAQGGIPRVPDAVQTRMASPSGQSVLTTPTAEYMAQHRVLTASAASQPSQTGTKGTVVFAMQQHEQDPMSTIAIEIKRAATDAVQQGPCENSKRNNGTSRGRRLLDDSGKIQCLGRSALHLRIFDGNHWHTTPAQAKDHWVHGG